MSVLVHTPNGPIRHELEDLTDEPELLAVILGELSGGHPTTAVLHAEGDPVRVALFVPAAPGVARPAQQWILEVPKADFDELANGEWSSTLTPVTVAAFDAATVSPIEHPDAVIGEITALIALSATGQITDPFALHRAIDAMFEFATSTAAADAADDLAADVAAFLNDN